MTRNTCKITNVKWNNSVPIVKNSQTAKMTMVYQSSHVYTESTEYTKSRPPNTQSPLQTVQGWWFLTFSL